MKQDVIIHNRDLGEGWSLWTEYKPIDEDTGTWGWYWALQKEEESFEVDREQHFPHSSLDDSDVVSGLEENAFGPFDTEEDALAAGIRFWKKAVDNPELWERLNTEALDNWIAWTKSTGEYWEIFGPEAD